MKAAAAERERRQREEMTASKAAQGSKHLIKQLQHKRFRQVPWPGLEVQGWCRSSCCLESPALLILHPCTATGCLYSSSMLGAMSNKACASTTRNCRLC